MFPNVGALDALMVGDARHAARADGRCRNGRRGGGPDRADVRAGVPRRLRRTVEVGDARQLRAYRAAFGNRPIDAIGAKDVHNWHDDIAATYPDSAHWALAAMSSMMKHAEALGLRCEDSSPCKGLRRRKTGFEAH